MKKIVIIASIILSIWFLWITFAKSSLDQSISRMNQNWLTRFSNAKDFMSSNSLRRDEASKFFVQYAKEILWLKPDTSNKSCTFTDLNKAWPDLKTQINEACQLWLFQWYNWKFMPSQQITNAQAITVFIRMIDGKKDETQWHFAQKYFEKAKELWIMSWLTLNYKSNFDKLTTRGDIGILLFNASKLDYKQIEDKTIEDLEDIEEETQPSESINNCPDNSHPDTTIINACVCNDWYKKNTTTNTCEAILCPENSNLEWNTCSCENGYRMKDNICEAIICPSNATLKWNICSCNTPWYSRNYINNTCVKCSGVSCVFGW